MIRISPPHRLVQVLVLLWLSVLPLTFANGVQFCRQDGKSLDICIATTTVQDISSKAVDSHILISTKSKRGVGWTGVGIGRMGMTGALMFVLYSGEDPDGKTPHMIRKHSYE